MPLYIIVCGVISLLAGIIGSLIKICDDKSPTPVMVMNILFGLAIMVIAVKTQDETAVVKQRPTCNHGTHGSHSGHNHGSHSGHNHGTHEAHGEHKPHGACNH